MARFGTYFKYIIDKANPQQHQDRLLPRLLPMSSFVGGRRPVPESFRHGPCQLMRNGSSGVRAANRMRFYSQETRAQAEQEKRLSRRSKPEKSVRRFSVTGGASYASRVLLAPISHPRSATGAALIARRIQGYKLSPRERLFLILEEPASGSMAKIFSLVLRFVTLLAISCDIVQSIPKVVEQTGRDMWTIADCTFFAIFTVEAFARVTCYVPLRRCLRDPFIWLDTLTVVPFLFRLLTAVGRGGVIDLTTTSQPQRVFEAFGSLRLLKISRYDEGAGLLARAVSRSMGQLYVPFFMLLILTSCSAIVVFHMEYSELVDNCNGYWLGEGVSAAFIGSRPAGVAWDCTACSINATGLASEAKAQIDDMCLTCSGFPAGHVECLGMPWAQAFNSVPKAMWFVLVTVTTIGFGDVVPVSWQGHVFVSIVMLLGVVFLAMPLSTVGNNFALVWEERQLYKLQVRADYLDQDGTL